jgi:hypothetical protein
MRLLNLRTGLLLFTVCGSLFGQPLDSLKEQWKAGRYRDVLPGLIAYWKQPGGRTWSVEYMIGTSECRVPGLAANGAFMLEDVLQTFRLPEEARRTTEGELGFCRQRASSPAQDPSFGAAPAVAQTVPGATVSGKGGYLIYSKESRAGTSISSVPVPIAELEKRLVPLTGDSSPGQTALAAAMQRALPGAGGAVADRFVVTSEHGGTYPSQVTGNCLNRYERALRAQFQMGLPPYYVTVYGVFQPSSVSRYSERLHGVPLALGTIAYSVYEDLSMVGVAEMEGCGTLAHELVHLMIRRNFGNSPSWLEEGIASEVAVSSPQGDRISFVHSWRDDMLVSRWSMRPTVEQLLSMDWTAYVARTNQDLDRVAAVHAMAACFTRYLWDKQQLLNVYNAIRDDRFDDQLSRRRTDREIVERTMGKAVDQIDADFVSWFRPAQPPSGAAPRPVKGAVER